MVAEEQAFAGASELIVVAPLAGRLYKDAHHPHVRRLLLRASRYHLYYVVRERDVRVIRGLERRQGHRTRSLAVATRVRPGRGAQARRYPAVT